MSNNGPLPALTLREAEQGETNFLLNSWMKSYQHAKCGTRDERLGAAGEELVGRAMRLTRYFRGQQELISALASVRRVLVVCDAEDPAFVVGWACGELKTLSDDSRELVVDYVYVKHAYRKNGIARELLKGLGWQIGIPIIATHWTKPCTAVASRYGAEFDEYELHRAVVRANQLPG